MIIFNFICEEHCLCINIEDLGITSSLIRPHYELSIDMVASSRKNKSRQGITIRKNKQPMSIVQSSNSHLNRTESSHSNNVRSAFNMIVDDHSTTRVLFTEENSDGEF